ncbi:hypothetical protein BD289DRAFT_422821, partial [Coniella lustricola]
MSLEMDGRSDVLVLAQMLRTVLALPRAGDELIKSSEFQLPRQAEVHDHHSCNQLLIFIREQEIRQGEANPERNS